MHGFTQGAISEMRGGRFKDGFLSGFASHYAAVESDFLPDIELERGAGAIAFRTTYAAMVGGIAAKLGGGKFQNGARTGAFVHLFNAEWRDHKGQLVSDGEKGPPPPPRASNFDNLRRAKERGNISGYLPRESGDESIHAYNETTDKELYTALQVGSMLTGAGTLVSASNILFRTSVSMQSISLMHSDTIDSDIAAIGTTLISRGLGSYVNDAIDYTFTSYSLVVGAGELAK